MRRGGGSTPALLNGAARAMGAQLGAQHARRGHGQLE